jgi:hypothetical protein
LATGNSVEALQLLIADKEHAIGDKNSTIVLLKKRAKQYIEKMKVTHAEDLRQATNFFLLYLFRKWWLVKVKL